MMLVIGNGKLFTRNDEMPFVENGAVAIEGTKIAAVGERKLDDIRTSDVIQWQNEIMKLKKDNGELFSPTYLKTIHNQLSAILNHAVNMYGLKDNVARKAGTMGKEENKEMEFWRR